MYIIPVSHTRVFDVLAVGRACAKSSRNEVVYSSFAVFTSVKRAVVDHEFGHISSALRAM